VNNKNKLIFGLLIAVVAVENSLADTKIGLGTGALSLFSRSFGGVISMPIKLDSFMLIEPYAGYSNRSEDPDTNSLEYNIYEHSSYQVGVGLFGISKLGTEFELYYGAALAAAKSEYKYEYQNTSVFNNETYVYLNRNNTETMEYMVKPTLGVSYLINENFSCSLDAGIYYYWGEAETEHTSIDTTPTDATVEVSKSSADTSGVNTFTRFIFRMMF
jgi:hypothetical protein